VGEFRQFGEPAQWAHLGSIGGQLVGCSNAGQYPCTPTAQYYSYFNQELTYNGHQIQLVVTGPVLTTTSQIFPVAPTLSGSSAQVQIYDNASQKSDYASSGQVTLMQNGEVDFLNVFVTAFGGAPVQISGSMTCGK